MATRLGAKVGDGTIRLQLASTLQGKPGGVVLGSVCGAAVAATVLVSSPTRAMALTALALAALSVTRAVFAVLFPKLASRLFAAGSLAFAGLVGLLAGLAFFQPGHPDLHLLLTGFAILYGSGIAIGNAGRPLLALGQMALAFVPIVVGCVASFTPTLLAFAVLLPAMGTGLVFVTLDNYRMLAERLFAARDSEELSREMREQAHSDTLTGLANRPGLERQAAELIADAGPDACVALFWIDLWRFSEINNMLGHGMGDRVLHAIAARLKKKAPEGSVLARFSADEFIVLTEVSSRAEAEALAATLTSELARPSRLSGHRIETGAAIGVALLPENAPDFERLMQKADLALYHAKVSDRCHARFFDGAMTRDLVRKKEIESELRGAIQKDELSIYFQPVIDLRTGCINSFEALVRWFHPTKGELKPDEFIPVAEETGLIITLGNWITRQAARTCATWPEHVSLAVNLSPAQIKAPGAALGVLKALQDARLDPARLQLEVTENLFLEEDPNTARFIEELAGAGVRFALDDFGTGYSSLHYINKYPFCTIKVDRSFVSGPQIGRKSDAIIRAVAEMGTTLDMQIVAEGIETVEQMHAVRAAGCTLGQGYYFSRAVPDHLAARLISAEAERLAPPLRYGS